MADIVYIADCHDCKHHWVSRSGHGTPERCPKCQSKRIALKPAK